MDKTQGIWDHKCHRDFGMRDSNFRRGLKKPKVQKRVFRETKKGNGKNTEASGGKMEGAMKKKAGGKKGTHGKQSFLRRKEL